ncbi:MAG: P-loop NTPase fold protein [Thermoplasmatota archaeon]
MGKEVLRESVIPKIDVELHSIDEDFLGSQDISSTLASILLHDNLEPPLSIALHGRWGFGKSSATNLLINDLERDDSYQRIVELQTQAEISMKQLDAF